MIDRIQLILKSKNLSPSQFADEIQVQRSSISHILSGRNKPSLDFIIKILSTYQEVNSDWLIFGKGQMVKQGNSDHNVIEQKVENLPPLAKKDEIKKDIPSYPPTQKEISNSKDETIEKIVVLYKNGTFKEFMGK